METDDIHSFQRATKITGDISFPSALYLPFILWKITDLIFIAGKW